ncbi:MAG: hypothetical protein PF448_04020 [Bacteroidales bacterium]|nr:hypothetical protein [Bacteroidales bacterium]
MNNPLKYTDPSGEFVWFVVGGAVLGSYIGGSIAAGDRGLTNANWNPFGGKAGSWAGTDWWKGAITGAMVGAGAGAGALTAATLGGTATTSLMTAASGEGASLGWSISSSALLINNINIASNFAQGRGVEGTWKAGLIGLGTGALGAYTSYGLTGSKLASDLGLSKEGISAISHSLSSGTYGFIDRNIRLREEGLRGWELFGYSMLGFVEGAGIGAQAGGVWSGNLLTQTALSSGITSFPGLGYSIMNFETLTLFSKINESTPKYPNELTLDKIVSGIISMF